MLRLCRKKRIVCGLMAAAAALTLVSLLWYNSTADQPEQASIGDALGLVLIDITDAEAAAFYHVDEFGVYVLAVTQPSLAYEAGIRSGDRILTLNGTPVNSTAQWSEAQENVAVNGEWKVVCSRNGAEYICSISLGGTVVE